MIKVTLTVEEWLRLAAVTREEREKAFRQLRRWVTWQIIKRGFNVEVGPFSRGAMGGDADDVICEECEEALFCGEVHWKPTRGSGDGSLIRSGIMKPSPNPLAPLELALTA